MSRRTNESAEAPQIGSPTSTEDPAAATNPPFVGASASTAEPAGAHSNSGNSSRFAGGSATGPRPPVDSPTVPQHSPALDGTRDGSARLGNTATSESGSPTHLPPAQADASADSNNNTAPAAAAATANAANPAAEESSHDGVEVAVTSDAYGVNSGRPANEPYAGSSEQPAGGGVRVSVSEADATPSKPQALQQQQHPSHPAYASAGSGGSNASPAVGGTSPSQQPPPQQPHAYAPSPAASVHGSGAPSPQAYQTSSQHSGTNADYPPAAAVGVPIGGPSPVGSGGSLTCRYSRSELRGLLERSGFGENRAMYDATFVRLENGAHACKTCGLQIGNHVDDNTLSHLRRPNAPAIDWAAYEKYPWMTEYPPHWKGAAWWLPYVAFSRYGCKHTHGKRRTRVTIEWRCTLPRPDGAPCEHIFETRGAVMSNGRPAGLVDLALEDESLYDHQQAADPIAEHFAEVHSVRQRLPGRFASGLFGCCAHPKSLLSCCCCYFCPPALCGDDDTAAGTCVVMSRLMQVDLRSIAVSRHLVQATRPTDRSHCSCAAVMSLPIFLFATPVLLLQSTVFFLITLLTLGGLPCNSDRCPPCLCAWCFERRRLMVELLGVKESPVATRCVSMFCWPCSELQMWREMHASGVWPGLACCKATETDERHMATAAIRQRYGLDDEFGFVSVGRDAGPFVRDAVNARRQMPPPPATYAEME